MPTYSAYITLDGLPVYDPVALARSLGRNNDRTVSGIPLHRVVQKCNSFTSQRGFLPGRGHVLMKAEDALDLDRSATNHSLVFSADGTATYSNLIITNVELVTGVESFTFDALCRVDLADLRVLGPFTSINRAYNVGPYTGSGYYTATKNAGATWTYEGIVNDIWSLMPAAFASLITAGADFPTGTPENYAFRGVTAWEALQTVLDDIQHILLLSKAGSFSVVKANNNDDLESTFDDNKPYILSGSHDLSARLHRIPATVRVFFPKADQAWQNNTDLQVVTSKDHYLLNPLYSVDVATSSITSAISTVSGTVHPIHDSLVAQYNELGVLSNSSALNNRATEVATAYILGTRYSDDEGLFTYSGARDLNPSHYIASVSYFDYGKGIQTTIRRAPREQPTHPHLDTQRLGGLSGYSYADENASPPDITRAHQQSERFVVVELYEDLEANGDALANVQYGTNAAGSIAWTDTLSTHQITVYNLTSASYTSGTQLVAWLHQQTQRWLIVAPPKTLCYGSISFHNVSFPSTVLAGGVFPYTFDHGVLTNSITDGSGNPYIQQTPGGRFLVGLTVGFDHAGSETPLSIDVVKYPSGGGALVNTGVRIYRNNTAGTLNQHHSVTQVIQNTLAAGDALGVRNNMSSNSIQVGSFDFWIKKID